MGNMFEIEAARLAERKVNDPAYRDFAKMIITDHTKAGNELKSQVKGMKGVEIPTKLDQEHKQIMQMLRSETGTNFEQQHREGQIQAHQDAIKLFQDYSQNGGNSELMMWGSDADRFGERRASRQWRYLSMVQLGRRIHRCHRQRRHLSGARGRPGPSDRGVGDRDQRQRAHRVGGQRRDKQGDRHLTQADEAGDTLIEPEPQPGPQPLRRTAPSPASASGRTVVGEASPAAPPPASPSAAGNTYRETCPKDAERMFVCSTLNAFIQAGKVHLEPEQLAAATMMLRRLWQYAFNGNGGTLTATAAPQQRQERRVVMAAE
jgi:Domain of unknown function (DUF4142)